MNTSLAIIRKFIFRPLLWVAWDLTGLHAVSNKIFPASNATTNAPSYKPPPTFGIWVFTVLIFIISTYFACFGFAVSRYERNINRAEFRYNTLTTQLSAGMVFDTKQVENVGNILLPAKPIFDFNDGDFFSSFSSTSSSFYQSLFGAKDHYYCYFDKEHHTADMGIPSRIENSRDFLLMMMFLWKHRLNRIEFNNDLLVNIDLSRSNFTEANLKDTVFTKVILQKAIFQNAEMIQTKFYETDLQRSEFQHSTLIGAHFEHSNLRKVNFSNADLTGVHLQEAPLNHTQFYNTILKNADLTKAQLIDTNMNKANLYKADLHGASLFNTNLEGANLTESILTKAMFVNVNLSNAILIKTDLRNTFLGTTPEVIINTLATVKSLYKTQLPVDIQKVMLKRYPSLFEKPTDYAETSHWNTGTMKQERTDN